MPDVLIIRLGESDPWGGGTDGERIVVRDVAIWPVRSDENNVSTVITGQAVWFDEGKPTPNSEDTLMLRIEVDDQGRYVEGTGQRYEVDGDPGIWEFLDGDMAGTEVQVRRARGI